MAKIPAISLRLGSATDSRLAAGLARHAEDAGFRAIWFAENPQERGALPAATAAALATKTLRIAIGVFNPYNRHPTLMAMEMGALDEISEGRAILGIGTGTPPSVAKFVPYEKPLSALRDTVAIARGLLAGGEVNHAGKAFSARGVKLSYPLYRQGMPIYIAAMGPKTLGICGEVADGLLIGNMCPPAFTLGAVAALAEGARKAGRAPPTEIAKYLPTVVGVDGKAARDALKGFLGRFLVEYMKIGAAQPGIAAAICDSNGIEPEHFTRCVARLGAGEAAAEVLDDRFVAAYGVAGTAEECLDQIARHGKDGVTETVLTFPGGGSAEDISRIGKAMARV